MLDSNTMRIIFALPVFLLCFACNNAAREQSVAPAHEAVPPPRYYFYPKANVYFDSVNKDYLFLGGDGATWTTQKQIPAAVQSMMDKGVLIQTPAQPVWKDNANHKLIYSAALYATAADTVEKKVSPPVKVDTAVKKEERKSGIGRFFSKLFGKKKKDKSKQ